MQQFARHKTQDEVRDACREAGFALDTTQYDKGSDYIKIPFAHEGQTYDVLYCSFNGRFMGSPTGINDCPVAFFGSDDGDLDSQPWYAALLAFFYIPIKEA